MSVEKLLERVLKLEAEFGLEAEGRAYAERLLALLDVFEARLDGEENPAPEPSTVTETAEAESLEAQISIIKKMTGDADHPVSKQSAETVEAALATIKNTLEGKQEEKPASYETYQEIVRSTNINETTLLATDYLNHFNEIVMTLEMIPDMPEILEEAKEWLPKSYKDHFRDSTIADKDLAVEVYDYVPDTYRAPFESTINQIDKLIATTIERVEADMERGDPNLLRENTTALSRTIQKLMDTAGAIIHGSEKTMDQSEIDALLF